LPPLGLKKTLQTEQNIGSDSIETEKIPGQLNAIEEKKEQGTEPRSKNCVDPIFPETLDLILIDRVSLLPRDRAPPETWTTRLQPSGQPEPARLDQVFWFVTNFSNYCSKFGRIGE
jgi:hypothetical protein